VRTLREMAEANSAAEKSLKMISGRCARKILSAVIDKAPMAT
jgi:hypothetical protein